MVQRLGDAYAGVLADYHRLLRAGLAVHGGEEVVIQGDGVFAVFASPRACVDAAIRVQRALMSHAWPAGERVRVRMSVHSGEAAEAAAETAAGLEVRRAARIAAVAHGDQVVVAHRSKTRPQRSTGGSGAKLIGPSQRYRATPQRIHLDFNHADQARQQPREQSHSVMGPPSPGSHRGFAARE